MLTSLLYQNTKDIKLSTHHDTDHFYLEYINKDLSVTSHINCIVALCLINIVYLTVMCLYQVMMTLHFLNDVTNNTESTQKLRHNHYFEERNNG